MKRKLRNGIIICACLMVCFFCIKQDNNRNEKKNTATMTANYQTVVFRDDKNTLVPIEVDFGAEVEDDTKYRNMIEVMKSNDYEYLGLHPILDSNLQVNAMAINDKSLTFDLSDNLYVNSNQEALDIFEMFSYVFCNGDIEKVNLKIDGMGCEHCVKSVREALETVKGIKILDVKIGSAEIEAENDGVLSEIKEKLDDVGYDLVR